MLLSRIREDWPKSPVKSAEPPSTGGILPRLPTALYDTQLILEAEQVLHLIPSSMGVGSVWNCRTVGARVS